MLYEVSMDAIIADESLHVSACGREVEYVAAVVGADAIGMLEHLFGFLFHHRLLGWRDVSCALCRRGYEEFISRAIEQCAGESASKFLSVQHESCDVDLSDRLHLSE